MFRKAEGAKYMRFMSNVLNRHVFDWYLEVGCRTGRIFAKSRGKTIAVDPYFQAEGNIIGIKPGLHVLQQTSDDFFASGFLKAIDARLSFSFLDGMHLFEYLLRDIINAERASAPEGVIALHDCCPYSFEMTTRDLGNLPRGDWTGDVWKLIPILAEYRPDLEITVLDAAPTGLVLLSNLDPNSSVLSDAYDDIIARFTPVTLEGFGLDRFNSLFDYTSTRAYLDGDQAMFARVALPEGAALDPQKITP